MKNITNRFGLKPCQKLLLALGIFAFSIATNATAQQSRLIKTLKWNLTQSHAPNLHGQLKVNSASLPGYSMNYIPDGAGGWTHVTNNAMTYNAAGELIENLETEAGTNSNIEKEVFVFDQHGNETQRSRYNWYSGAWQLTSSYKTDFTYNSSDQLTEEITSDFNFTLNTYEPFYKLTHTYLANGNRNTELYSSWTGTTWEPRNLRTFTYNSNNEISEVLLQRVIGGNFINHTLSTDITWGYFGQEYPTTCTTKHWDGTNWYPVERENTSFDGITFVQQSDTFNIGNWVPVRKNTDIFDQHGNLTSYQTENWNGANWEMDEQGEDELTYDVNFNLIQRIMRYAFTTVNVFEDHRKEVYSNFVLGTKASATELPVTVYPNPAQHKLTISSTLTEPATVVLTDLSGRIVLLQNLAITSGELNIAHLPAGTYLVRISGKQGSKTTKIVKL